jgi:hypothetical protein
MHGAPRSDDALTAIAICPGSGPSKTGFVSGTRMDASAPPVSVAAARTIGPQIVSLRVSPGPTGKAYASHRSHDALKGKMEYDLLVPEHQTVCNPQRSQPGTR